MSVENLISLPTPSHPSISLSTHTLSLTCPSSRWSARKAGEAVGAGASGAAAGCAPALTWRATVASRRAVVAGVSMGAFGGELKARREAGASFGKKTDCARVPFASRFLCSHSLSRAFTLPLKHLA